MKQSRRQELKTNELSVLLQQAYETASRNVNYIIGGVVLVILILVAMLYIQHRRTQAREDAWSRFNALQAQIEAVIDQPEILDQAKGFAAEMQGNEELKPRANTLVADMAYKRAMHVSPTSNRDERLNLLKEARDRYQEVVTNQSERQPALAARARLGLAAVEESLLMAGEGSREKAREQYEILAKGGLGLYSEMAADLLQTFDERVQPLKLVATRPAESPATAPATRTATTQPAATQTATAQPGESVPASTETRPAAQAE